MNDDKQFEYDQALEKDSMHKWQKKYLGESSLEKALDMLSNIDNTNLFKVMLQRNGLNEKTVDTGSSSTNN